MDQTDLASWTCPPDIWRPFAQQRGAIRCPAGFLIYLQGTEATCFYYLRIGPGEELHPVRDGASGC
ncbi:MAG: hypothetical protein V8S86_05590 [Eubacteriales bacterium]